MVSKRKGKIVGVVGSGRRRSNSRRLLEAALSAAERLGFCAKLVDVLDLNFCGCNGCGECEKTGECTIEDDLTPIYKLLDEADAVIVAAPVYFYSVPGQLKLFIDRFQARWAKRYVLGIEPKRTRPGGLISIAGSSGERVFDGVVMPIKYFMKVQGIELVEPLLFRGWSGNPQDLPENMLRDAQIYGETIAVKAKASLNR